MIEIPVSERIRKLSTRKAVLLGERRNSIRKGKGNVHGYVGEFLVARYLGRDAKIVDSFHYDILHYPHSLEVKTKSCAFKPKPHYEVSVAAYNLNQHCDYYVFVRVLEDLSKGWILGYYESNDYVQDARFRQTGEVDGDFVFKADCYNMPISKLKQFYNGIPPLRSAQEVQHLLAP